MDIKRLLKRAVIDSYKTLRLYKYYHLFGGRKLRGGKNMIVSMIDGRVHHGGLSDRLCGIVSAFMYCQEHNLDFRINFTYPFELSDFLQPKDHDWTIEQTELSYNVFGARPIYLSKVSHKVEEMRKVANLRLSMGAKQIHLYSNMSYFTPSEFGIYFNRLFKMSPVLEREVNNNLRSIGWGGYITVTFRFQQLLGDFKETGFATIGTEEQRQKLLGSCICTIQNLYLKNNCKIVVTSDSKTFLDEAAKLEYVYVIPGNVVHMDFIGKEDVISLSTHLKSFVDFFVIANAEKIYLASGGPLYNSSFPHLASWVYGREFAKINIDS